jgi:AraC family transcriptional activator FtrA
VFSAFRDGGQQQFIEQPVAPAGRPVLSQTLDWARTRLGTTLSVADLARHARLSATTLHRRFRAELGTTPLAWLTAERVDLARRLIEQGVAPLDLVAHHSGLGTAANLRAQMRRRTGLSPTQYRARFAEVSAPLAYPREHLRYRTDTQVWGRRPGLPYTPEEIPPTGSPEASRWRNRGGLLPLAGDRP